MHRPLNEDLVRRLQAFTPSDARTVPPGHTLTSWHRNGVTYPGDYTRAAWDREGTSGLYGTWFPVGRVHWLEAEGCWRWQAFYPGGARSGLSATEQDQTEHPLLAMRRVNAYLEIYGLWPDELRGTMTTKHAPEPCLSPLEVASVVVHREGYVLSEWSRLRPHTGGSTTDRYVRVWLHSMESLERLAPSERTGKLAQRVFLGRSHAAVLIQPSRGRWWSWSLHEGVWGKHRKKDTAAGQAFSALLKLGASLCSAEVVLSLEPGAFSREEIRDG